MIKVITVLVSTLTFTLLGLFIGYLNVQANMPPPGSSRYFNNDILLFSYGFAPVAGAMIGFVLSAVTIRLFGPKNTD